MGDVVASAEPGERAASGIQRGSFTDLFIIQALAADGDALRTQDGGQSGLGDAVATADLLGGLTGLVTVHDVGDVLSAQEAFGAGFSDILSGRMWSRW